MIGFEDKTAPAYGTVAIEAGGDHRFDLVHLRREGAVQLVRYLLKTAGYRKQLQWRVRVEKKLNCGAETKAITIVGSKPWCCYVKIKPGDNNTAHFCSLLMPDGFHGETVYEALKAAEEQVNTAWRHGFTEELGLMDDNNEQVTANGLSSAAAEAAHRLFDSGPGTNGAPENGAPVPAEPLAEAGVEAETEAGEDEEAESNQLRGWTHDADKVRLTLLAIHEVCQDRKAADLDEFVTILAGKLGWEGLRRKQIGGIFTAMVRHGLIARVRQGSVAIGYALAAAGQALVRDMLPQGALDNIPPVNHVAAVHPMAAVHPTNGLAPSDPARLAAALTEAAQGYAADYQKLQANRARRAQLAAEIERLDAEAGNLSRTVANPEVQALLAKLLQLTGPRSTTSTSEGNSFAEK